MATVSNVGGSVEDFKKVWENYCEEYYKCDCDPYLMSAVQAINVGIDTYLAGVTPAEYSRLCNYEIDKLADEGSDPKLIEDLRCAQSILAKYCGRRPNRFVDELQEATTLLAEYGVLVSEQDLKSKIEERIALMNGETIKSPLVK